MQGGDLFDGVCERQQRPRHHPEAAVGERFDVEVAPHAGVQLHALHAAPNTTKKRVIHPSGFMRQTYPYPEVVLNEVSGRSPV